MTHKPNITLRLISLLTTVGMLLPTVAYSADETTITFVPACAVESSALDGGGFGGEIPDVDVMVPPGNGTSTPCPSFTITDPKTIETGTMRVGDIISLSIVIENPTKSAINDVRAWVAYDPEFLEGTEIKIDPGFPKVTPGESDFSAEEGYAKIGASATSGRTDEKITVATVTFKVVKTGVPSTAISFYDAGTDEGRHTAVKVTKNDTKVSVLSVTPPTIIVRLQNDPSASSAAATTSSSAASVAPQEVQSSDPFKPAAEGEVIAQASPSSVASSSAPTTPVTSTIFPDLKVSNLRVTTQGSAVYLGWDMLPSAELVGYNIYYSATSGQYLQRKTIGKSEKTLAIRGLPENITYYFAIRGVNAAGIETEFSPEVSVTVGKPQTSTAPLSASVITGPNGKSPKTGGNLSGETGVGSSMAILLLICAMTGTVIAGRRQFVALTDIPHVS